MARRRRRTIIAIAIGLIAVLVPAFALAHIERASYWPDPAADTSVNPPAGGSVPQIRDLYSALKGNGHGHGNGHGNGHGHGNDHGHGHGHGKSGTTRIVCQPDSVQRLDADLAKAQTTGYKIRPSQPAITLTGKEAKTLRHFNEKLFKRCTYHSIQSAVTDSHNNDRIEVMPGLYTEPESRAKPTNDPACDQYKITNDKNQAGAVSYAYQVHCPNDQNLIAVLGRALTDTPVPQPPLLDRHGIPDAGPCIRCNLQIQGTGASPDAVTIDAGNTASGDGTPIDPVKDVGIRADRADGFVLDNVKVRHAREHDVYVPETDGSHLNRLKVPYAGEYGVLTFVADHSLIENCDAWGSGDAGLYPGATADLGEAVPPAQRRYGTEIRTCDMHHNLLGYSGTDGNAIWIHDNEFYDNSMGYSTDVFTAPGHPGFPQDSNLLEHNDFHSNNFNSYLPLCQGSQKPGPNGPNQVCSDVTPAEPVPVGTGLWVAGGNANVIRHNRFWNNWRRGAMVFQVPDALVCDDPNNQVAGCDPKATVPATSYRNQLHNNTMGVAPDGTRQPNGLDFWWDQGGISADPTLNTGNCWYGNTGPDGTTSSITGLPSPGAAPPNNLPSNCNNSPSVGAKNGQLAELITCVTVPKGDPRCPWFTTPAKP